MEPAADRSSTLDAEQPQREELREPDTRVAAGVTPALPSPVPSLVSPEAQTEEFFEQLWGDKEEAGKILIWSGILDERKLLIGKRSLWAENAKLAANLVRAELRSKIPRDIYVGVGLREKALPAPGRGAVVDISCVAGLWADVDFQSPVHKGKNYPPDEPAAMKLIESLGLAPTLTVHSGHGLQFWWLFKELLWFDGDARVSPETARFRFALLSDGWQKLIRARAKQLGGWDVDATGDLARVLRVPGTRNYKGEPVVPVRLLKSDGPRYADQEPFENLIGNQRAAAAQIETEFKVTESSSVDPEKFSLLREVEPRFARSFDHKRPDLDQSSSGYEMSLAFWAAQAGWSDQEIASLMIMHRKKWEPEKLKKLVERTDYLARTISRARMFQDRGIPEKDAVGIQRTDEGSSGVEPPERKDQLEGLWSRFGGLRVNRVVKYGKIQADYLVYSENEAPISITKREWIFNNGEFVMLVMEHTKGRCLPARITQKVWDNVVKTILDIAEEIELPESTDQGMILDWIDSYLEEAPPITEEDDLELAMRLSQPLQIDGRLFVNSSRLRRFVSDQGEKLSPRKLGILLRQVGFEQTPRNFVDAKGVRRKRRYWSRDKDLAADLAGNNNA